MDHLSGRLIAIVFLLALALRACADGKPDLLGGLGHGLLGMGKGKDALEVSLTWSPGYGHIHYDGLALLVFAQGKELLSDLGYTHTRAREWTIQSASHNLVVVDHANQTASKDTLGKLRYYHVTDGVQMMSVDNPQVYPDLTETYRRTVALVKLEEGNGYVVDVFRVKGGRQHDYFLHGSADDPQTLTAKVPAGEITALETLVPAKVTFTPSTNEQTSHTQPGMAYGYLHDLKQVVLGDEALVDLTYRNEKGAAGLQAFLSAKAGDRLIVGTNPAIRGAGSDDSKLPLYNRQFAMLRREGGDSLFVSVLAPFGDKPVVEGVKRVNLPGAALALEVQAGARRDLIVIDGAQVQGQWQGQAVAADTELGIIATEGTRRLLTTVGGPLGYGGAAMKCEALQQAKLLGVERKDGTGTLLLGKGLVPTPGTVILVDHAGKRVSPYTVKSISAEGEGVRVALVEDPGFEYDAATQTSKFVFLPRESYSGEHVVRFVPLAQVRVK